MEWLSQAQTKIEDKISCYKRGLSIIIVFIIFFSTSNQTLTKEPHTLIIFFTLTEVEVAIERVAVVVVDDIAAAAEAAEVEPGWWPCSWLLLLLLLPLEDKAVVEGVEEENDGGNDNGADGDLNVVDEVDDEAAATLEEMPFRFVGAVSLWANNTSCINIWSSSVNSSLPPEVLSGRCFRFLFRSFRTAWRQRWKQVEK